MKKYLLKTVDISVPYLSAKTHKITSFERRCSGILRFETSIAHTKILIFLYNAFLLYFTGEYLKKIKLLIER